MIADFRAIIAKTFKILSWQPSTNSQDDANNQITAVAQNSIKAKARHDLIFWLGAGLIGLLIFAWLKYRSITSAVGGVIDEKEPLKLEVASEALDSEKMWRNHFEDKLGELSSKTLEKMELIENSINEQSTASSEVLKAELDKLKSQIKYLSEEQVATKKQLLGSQLQLQQNIESKNHALQNNVEGLSPTIKVNNLERQEIFDLPKSSRNFIPETAYVSGILLGGLAVSTAIGSRGEPVAVDIKITSRGSLPKNFNIDLTTCKILGSGYGDLSAERAIIRAEVLSCTDPVNEMIYTTKIAGQIFGDDGLNGVKGRVVQTSNKQLKNAVIGGMISGFSSNAKNQGQFAISSIGAISTKQQGIGETLRNSSLEGLGNAGEKIADYYIRQAESMSPILIISGGVRVDILFTKGVYLGAMDVKKQLAVERK